MALKSYAELRKIDVLPFCEHRSAKDEKGNKIDVPYLNWAKCVDLLHEHGAEEVYYVPLKSSNGGYLFTSKTVHDKNERVTGCYFVSVEIHIDDKVFTMDMPLMNGSLVVYDDTMNQLRIANCHARAFVKGVAIHTGLGFQLWLKEEQTDNEFDDLSAHSIYAIKERIQRLMTVKMQNGLSYPEVLGRLGIKEKIYENTLKAFDNIALLESRLKQI